MSLGMREVKGVSIIDIDGKIDINSSEIIESVGLLVNSGKINILLNMSNVDMMDYNGLSILAISYKNVTNHGGKMKFLSVPASVIELFKVVKLDFVFQTFTDEKSAVESFFNEEYDKLHHLRRKFDRVEIHVNVRYNLESAQKKPKIFEGKALNISAAGLYIYSPYTFPLNSILDLKIDIPGRATPLKATGRVIYHADEQMQSHVYPGMGVSFVHLTPGKERVVIDFIDKNITHRSEPL